MISDRLKQTIFKELDIDEVEISDTTVASDVPGWDSLSHVGIILAVEREYKVRFSTIEVLGLRNIGDLQALVERKSAK